MGSLRSAGERDTSTIAQAGETRSARVESLRALAALAVLEGHVFGEHHNYNPAQTLDTFAHRFLFAGGLGVYIFFALTGYLLYWPFVRRHYGSGPPIDLGRYALNRALRILPLYFAAVAILLIVQRSGGSGTLWWHYLTLTENFSNSTIGAIDGPLWSVVVEVHFYVLLPLIALGLAWLSRRSAGRTALLLIGLAVVSYFVRRHAVAEGPVDRLLEFSLPATFQFFVAGMLLALLRLRLERTRPAWLGGWLGAGDLWLLVALPALALVIDDYSRTYLMALASFLVVGACVLPLRPGRAVRSLGWRPLATLGIASYSLYVWHDPVLHRIAQIGSLRHHFLLLLAIAVVVCCAIALLSYAVIETPFLRLRRQWSATAAPKAAPDASRSEEPAAAAATSRAGS